MNVQYIPEFNKVDRFPKQRSNEINYVFYYQILFGFEICPQMKEKDLNTFLEVSIGSSQKEPIRT